MVLDHDRGAFSAFVFPTPSRDAGQFKRRSPRSPPARGDVKGMPRRRSAARRGVGSGACGGRAGSDRTSRARARRDPEGCRRPQNGSNRTGVGYTRAFAYIIEYTRTYIYILLYAYNVHIYIYICASCERGVDKRPAWRPAIISTFPEIQGRRRTARPSAAPRPPGREVVSVRRRRRARVTMVMDSADV